MTLVDLALPDMSGVDVINEIRARQQKTPLRVEVQLEKGKTIAGKLGFIDNAVDVTTGTIKLRGIFANDDRQLWPGQFVESWVTLRDEDKALVVPTQALQVGPKGQYVYVVKADSSAELRPVQVDRTEGVDTVIAGGLKAGETVVVDGASRILPGAKVSAKAPEGGKAPDAEILERTEMLIQQGTAGNIPLAAAFS